MQKTLTTMVVALLVGVFAAPAYADITSQFTYDTYVGSNGGNTLWYLGTPSTVPQTLSSITLVGQSTTSASTVFTARITCFADVNTSSQTGCTDIFSHSAINSVTLNTQRSFATFYWDSFPLQANKAYLIEVFSSSGNGLWGKSTYQFSGQCQLFGSGATYCSGTPYFALNSAIDFNAISTSTLPLVFNQYAAQIAASSSLWGAFATTSTLVNQCATGNLLGDGFCTAFTFIFVPNPNTLNAFFAIPQLAQQKFPFSWIYGIQDEIDTLQSTSTNMANYQYGLHDLGIGSTTPMGNVLPNFTVFSTTTIQTYISQGMWNAFMTLIAASLWLALVYDVFITAKRLAQPH